MAKQLICHALNCNNETDETFFYCDSNHHTLCGDCLIPLEECQHAGDYVLSNNDKRQLRLIASSLMTKEMNK
jgi:hypothetical protein